MDPKLSNLGYDFAKLGVQLWPEVARIDARKDDRLAALETLSTWRNAIAHQDWSRVGPDLRLATVRAWRSVCRGLPRRSRPPCAGWSEPGPGDRVRP
jgi:hypothetical protein